MPGAGSTGSASLDVDKKVGHHPPQFPCAACCPARIPGRGVISTPVLWLRPLQPWYRCVIIRAKASPGRNLAGQQAAQGSRGG
ncbi:hypothetical protein DXA36_29325 [Eisenbergiella sp. OF01-20]|nr:hypothetical protein DXA36_29325 [Eisenbergiella sp. OF01-20]